MINWFNIILVKPLLNLLVIFYNIVPGHDIGVVIVLLTILIRAAMIPSFHKSLHSQKKMADLQPKMNEIRAKYKNDQAEQAKKLMELYKQHKISPFSSCLPLLIQFPILIALYQALLIGLSGHNIGSHLYHFVHNPGVLNPYFVHWINLAKPSVSLGIIAGIVQFIQSKMMMPQTKSNDTATRAMSAQALYILPAITVLFSLKLPAGLPLYWIVMTLVAIVQQYYIMRSNKIEAV